MDHHLTRRAFLTRVAAAGVSVPLLTQLGGCAVPGLAGARGGIPPNGRLNHVTFGGAGFAASDVRELTSDPRVNLYAIVDVDELRAQEMRSQFPDARYYQDWREFFAWESGNFDSCNVTIPDHMHAAVAMTALNQGKHVYCQKPLCHTLYETRRLAEAAAGRPTQVTQMGVQIHSELVYRQAVQLIQDGVIGSVHTVYSWSRRALQPHPSPPPPAAVPPNLEWDGWLGVAAPRPYREAYYHPGVWRARVDFGLGRLGDFGPHIFDPVFTALELTAPTSIQSLGEPPNDHSWGVATEVVYDFPATRFTAPSGLTLAWFDANRNPPQHMMTDLEGVELPNGGSAIIGTEGTMLLQHYGPPPRLFPEERFRGVTLPELPEKNHWIEFVDACHGIGQTSTPFTYAGPLTEAILAGTVAQRYPGERLEWNAPELTFGNGHDANRYVKRDFRRGWEVDGLA